MLPLGYTLAEIFLDARKEYRRLNGDCQRAITVLSNGASAKIVFDIMDRLVSAKAVMTTAKNTSGMGQYVRDAYGDQATDFIAAFNATLAAVDTVITWVTTNFPKDGDGYLLFLKFDAQGNTVERQFTAGQTTQLRAHLQAIIDTFD